MHHLFPIITEERDALATNLAKAGIQTGIHYEQSLPRTPAFSSSPVMTVPPPSAGRACSYRCRCTRISRGPMSSRSRAR